MRTLVAGSGGFIAGHLVRRLLDDGHEVRAVDIKPFDDLGGEGVEGWWQYHKHADNYEQVDLSDRDNCEWACGDMDRVYNLAAFMGGMGTISAQQLETGRNVLISTNMLEAADRCGVERYTYCSSACFPAGTYVATTRGSVLIEEIREDDLVLTETGHPSRVAAVTSRMGTNFVQVKPWGRGGFSCTDEHRILTKNGWTRAKDLRTGDHIWAPLPHLDGTAQGFRFEKDRFARFWDDLQAKSAPIYILAKKHGLSQATAYNISKRGWWPKKMCDPVRTHEFRQDAALGEIVGMYLGNGWCEKGSQILFSFNDDARADQRVARLIGLFESVFGVDPSRWGNHRSPKQHGQKIELTSRALVEWFSRFYVSGCQRTAPFKRIGELVVGPLSWREGIVRGLWQTDGSRTEYEVRPDRFVYATTSPTLESDVRLLLNSLGIWVSVQHREPSGTIQGRNVNCQIGRSLYPVGPSVAALGRVLGVTAKSAKSGMHVHDDLDGWWVEVRSVEGLDLEDQPVFNMHVDPVHSFLVDGLAVHNCIYPGYRQAAVDSAGLREDEAWPAEPQDMYGLEKLFSEELALRYARQRGLAVRLPRLHNCYGIHGSWTGGKEKAPSALCAKVARAVVSGMLEVEIWGDGEQRRSFMHSSDCVEGLIRLADSDYAEPINLGTEEVVTINQLVTIIEEAAGVTCERHYDLSAPVGVRGRSSDNTLVRSVLGWEPTTSLRDGIAELYPWIESMVRKEHGQQAGELDP